MPKNESRNIGMRQGWAAGRFLASLGMTGIGVSIVTLNPAGYVYYGLFELLLNYGSCICQSDSKRIQQGPDGMVLLP